MADNARSRQPRGIPVGGQFAITERREADDLIADYDACADAAMAALNVARKQMVTNTIDAAAVAMSNRWPDAQGMLLVRDESGHPAIVPVSDHDHDYDSAGNSEFLDRWNDRLSVVDFSHPADFADHVMGVEYTAGGEVENIAIDLEPYRRMLPVPPSPAEQARIEQAHQVVGDGAKEILERWPDASTIAWHWDDDGVLRWKVWEDGRYVTNEDRALLDRLDDELKVIDPDAMDRYADLVEGFADKSSWSRGVPKGIRLDNMNQPSKVVFDIERLRR